jgi:predicted NBD/HSP70 family sugar kinase
VSRSGADHRDGGRCGCSGCWEKLIAGLAEEAQGQQAATGSGSTSAFSFSDLFGGPQQRP